jgi:glycerol-3-phosphate dehydrogenase
MTKSTQNIANYDVAIVGGGIHGVGVAQAAAAAGYSAVLLEQTELAAGTSSKSSKLIHGGLRYLESFEFSLVRESLIEREILLKIAPDLVKRQAFYIPVYQHTSRSAWWIGAGLSFYALLAGLKKNTRFRIVPKQEWGQLDGITKQGLKTVLQYWDAQTDDAKLTRAVMQSAQEMGAQSLCPAQFRSAKVGEDGVNIEYRYKNQNYQLHAKTVVNAAGPWANDVLQKVAPQLQSIAVDNIQGTHIELPGSVDKGCYYLEVPEDNRVVFVMPWYKHTMVGTTERMFTGDPAKVKAVDESVDYLLKVYKRYFPNRSTEVINKWAGLRVLPAAQGAAFKRSRETQMPVDNEQSPRVLSIFGGKLTGYRSTAEKVVKKLKKTLPKRTAIARAAGMGEKA